VKVTLRDKDLVPIDATAGEIADGEAEEEFDAFEFV
jgi:hypothetical protein